MNTDSPKTTNSKPEAKKPDGKRRGVVLVAVLVVVASLSLAGYHYADLMYTEDKGSVYAHRNAQAKALAESGVHWAAAMLADSDSYNGVLGGNPWNNPGAFPDGGTEVTLDGDLKGYFRIMAPPDPDAGLDPKTPIGGVTDEGGKINPNALMKMDPTGEKLHGMLIKLPNMTEEIANNIVAWMGGSVGTQNGGQTAYPSYRAKNGPLDSIDELLLVQGVTPQLLYGWDTNRNGFLNGKEVDDGNGRGWAAYLTVHSREQTCDPFTGVPYVGLNGDDLNQLSTDLTNANIDENLAKFIIMYRQRGASNAKGQSQSLGSAIASLLGGGGGGGGNNSSTVEGDLASYQLDLTKPAKYEFQSLMDLIGKSVSIQKFDDKTKKTITTIYASPLNDSSKMPALLSSLFAKSTIQKTPEIAARININTAPMAVLATLPGLDETDLQKIKSARETADLSSAAWILTDAQISPDKLVALENLITTRTQVYRVQSVGFLGGKGPAVRLEAVIDTNSGRPRIIAWRDLTELGKGLP